jgi:hypothetical protein
MARLFSVECGPKELPNLCRMTTSIVVLAETPDEAVQYVEIHCPDVLADASIQHVIEAQHVEINWQDGETLVIEK